VPPEQNSNADYHQIVIDILQTHSQEVLDNKDTIDDILHENTHKIERFVGFPLIRDAIVRLFARYIEEEHEQQNLATAVLYSAENWMELQDSFAEEGVAEELQDFLFDLNVKYEAEIERARAQGSHGGRLWDSAESELVRRSSGAIGINHYFEMYSGERVEIRDSASSVIELVEMLIRDSKGLVDEFGYDAVRAIDQDELEEIREDIEELSEEIASIEEDQQMTLSDAFGEEEEEER